MFQKTDFLDLYQVPVCYKNFLQKQTTLFYVVLFEKKFVNIITEKSIAGTITQSQTDYIGPKKKKKKEKKIQI